MESTLTTHTSHLTLETQSEVRNKDGSYFYFFLCVIECLSKKDTSQLSLDKIKFYMLFIDHASLSAFFNTYRNPQRVLLTWTGVSGAVEPPTLTGAETKRKYQHNYFPVPFFWL